MSVNWNKARERWQWQFKAKIEDRQHRLSKLLPRGWSETQAKRYDQQETARTYARLTSGKRASSVPLIDQAVSLYLTERVPNLLDGKHSAQNLAHLLPWFSGKTLDQLPDIARDYAKTMAKELAPATIKQRLMTIRSAASYALKQHSMGSLDWLDKMPMPAVDNERNVSIGRLHVVRAARACKDRGTRALVLMTFGTGSRPGECHRSDRYGDDALLMPKTKNGSRSIKPVPRKLRYLLRYWPMQYGYTYYAERWREARKKVGLDHVHQHDLRHATASELLGRGASLAQIGGVLDHKSAQSTKRYAHIPLGDKARLLEGIWQKRPNKRSAQE